VCIVKLDRVVLCKIVEIVTVILLVSVNDVLERCRNEEILLSYTEYLTIVRSVVRVEDSPDVLYTVSLDNRIIESL